MIPLILFILAAIISFVELVILKKKRTKEGIIEICLLNALLFFFGFGGILGFIGHIFFPNQTAELIGWSAGSPFQFEVGIANLAFGALGLSALFFRESFWLGAIIGNTVWMWGDALGHVRSIIIESDRATGNTGLYLYGDVFFPIITILLFIIHVHFHRRKHPLKK